ncbi:cyclin-like protein [Chytridium lagenaria]|nr:cyclin-like protein [Chytridium lagenaria]
MSLWRGGVERSRSNNWIFHEDELRSTPSARDGISWARETADRAKGCQFIFTVGMALQLPQTAMATACVYFHRFYMRQSLKAHNYYDVGGTCIFLAAKIEEHGRN